MNKKENISKVKKTEYLPKKLIEKLNEDIFNTSYQYPTKNNFLKCVGLIYHKQIKEYNGLDVYVALGRNYWKKVFGGNYYEKVIKPLLEKNIIQSLDFGYRNFNTDSNANKSKGLVGIRYRINPELLNEEFEQIQYLGNGVSADEVIYNDSQSYDEELIPDKNFHIGIDHKKARKWVVENAEQICVEYLNKGFVDSLPDNLIVEYHEYLNNGSYNTRYSTISKLKDFAQKQSKELFFYKDSFYVADAEEFLKHRMAGMIYHYQQEISKIGRLKIENKRSKVTGRLHNYLVNFPSKILHFITINNSPVVQLDLRTSQLLLFANIVNVYLKNGQELLLQDFQNKTTHKYLKRLFKVLDEHKALLPAGGVDIHNQRSTEQSTSDVIKFIRDVFFYDFYSVLKQELGLASRGLAKLLLFKLIFKKTSKPDKLVELLNQRYPTIMSVIAGFKKVAGKNEDESNFSVFLQRIESEIFVDKVLIPLREKDIPCFTRHDSVVVAEGYEKEVEDHIKKVFEDMDFQYKYVVEEKFWDLVDYEYLDDIGYLEWLADETDLNTDFSAGGGWGEKTYEEIEENLTFIRLREIGLHEDYFEYVDVDFLEEISELPTLNQQQKNWLYDDITNLREGFNFLSTETNNLLRNLVLGF